MRQPLLLIDGDIDAYIAAASSATELDFDDGLGVTKTYDLEKAKERVRDRLEGYQNRLKSDSMIVCLSCDGDTFRHSVDPTYKGNRDPAAKPPILSELKAWIEEEYTVKKKPLLEADDVMGITSTLMPNKCIIVSDDKDMKTIPGRLYIPRNDELMKVSAQDADRWHMYQTLIGDATDHYKGCVGIGPKKADEYLDAVDPADWWFAVVETFKCRKSTEQHALQQARLARILRASDYNFNTGEVRLWLP